MFLACLFIAIPLYKVWDITRRKRKSNLAEGFNECFFNFFLKKIF